MTGWIFAIIINVIAFALNVSAVAATGNPLNLVLACVNLGCIIFLFSIAD